MLRPKNEETHYFVRSYFVCLGCFWSSLRVLFIVRTIKPWFITFCLSFTIPLMVLYFFVAVVAKKKKKKNVIIQAIIVSHSRGADYFLMRIPSGKECLTICGAFWNWNEHINWCQERVFLGVYTNIAHDALILMVLSYLLKAERMTLRCFREVFIHACLWVRKGLKVKRAVWCRQ